MENEAFAQIQNYVSISVFACEMYMATSVFHHGECTAIEEMAEG
jgi:hypothetical protein